MSVVNITGGLAILEGLTLNGDNETAYMIFKGAVRIAGGDSGGGDTQDYPSDFPHGEAFRLRMQCNFTDQQFQGLYMRVRMAEGVANTAALRGMEIEARSAADENVGELTGIHCNCQVKGDGTIGYAAGLHAQLSMDNDTPTITKGAAIRAKLQTEDGATLTAVSGIIVENEAITGIGLLKAVLLAESTSGGIGFECGMDLQSTGLSAVGSNEVDLIRFKDSGGTLRALTVNNSGSVSSRTL